jgi:dTMP kinase
VSADGAQPGRFIVLEGGDAAGKSTQVARLVERLATVGVDALATFEPGATPAGARIRDLLLHRAEHVAPITEALLMAADRAQHVADVVRPALGRGVWVVSDRYVPSSLVYQGVVRGVGAEEIHALNRVATGGLDADLVVVLDIDDDAVTGRRLAPSDRLEAEGVEFQRAVRDAYRELARRCGWSVVDGRGSADRVADCVWQQVEPLLGGAR